MTRQLNIQPGQEKCWTIFPQKISNSRLISRRFLLQALFLWKWQILLSMQWNGHSPLMSLKRATFTVLDIIAHNNWKRPIYFSITTGNESYQNLEPYFQLEGLAYRLVPIKATKESVRLAGMQLTEGFIQKRCTTM